jgi:hypothetical protein
MRLVRWSFCLCLVCACSFTRAQEPTCSPYLKPRFLSSTSEKKVSTQYEKVIPAGSTLRFVLPVLNDETLLVYEPPNPENDPLEPDTHLLLLRGGVVAKRISFRKMGIRKEYRVVSAARLCPADKTVIFLAAGAGATGASEFFVALLFDETGFRTFMLPEANQGRLEIFESGPLHGQALVRGQRRHGLLRCMPQILRCDHIQVRS